MVSTLLMTMLLLGCQAEDPCPAGSMLDSDQGLVVTEEEHPDGWARSNCWECHVAMEIHRTGCTPDVDLDAISDLVDTEGLSSCATCHGDNGGSQ